MANFKFLKSNYLKLVYLFLGWKVALLFVTFLGLSTLPHLNSSGAAFWPTENVDYWIRWANWDGGHFRGIAEHGYLKEQLVFYPLFPLLIKFISLTGLNTLYSGLFLSNLFCLISLVFLYKIAEEEYGEKIALKSAFFLLTFPTSFYLGAVYSESLFLALTLMAIYYSKKEKWLKAFILAGLSLSTRNAGLATVLAVTAGYLIQKGFKITKLFSLILYLSLAIIPFLLFIYYQSLNFGDPLLFIRNEFSHQRGITPFWQPVISYFSYLSSVHFLSFGNGARSLNELLTLIIFSLGLIFTFKRLDRVYRVYYLISFFLPLFTGTLIALPRYYLTIFPFYFLLAQLTNPILKEITKIFFLTLLGLLSVLFINNYWVS